MNERWSAGSARMAGALRVAGVVAVSGALLACDEQIEPAAYFESLELSPAAAKLEVRMSYAPADRFRRPSRSLGLSAGTSPQPSVLPPGELLAGLERRGENSAIAAAYLFAGLPDAALRALENAPPSADVWADRAAVHVALHDHRAALRDADEALKLDPRHAQASWNRAIALRELELDLMSATAFEVSAAASSGAWVAEARSQAKTLRAAITERRDAWTAARAAGTLIVASSTATPDLELARRFPGVTRLFFYDALRVAPSVPAIARLLPLAETLDEAHGGDVLRRLHAKVLAADFKKRAPLARGYAALMAGSQTPAETAQLLRDAARFGADDILLGALYYSDAAYEDPKRYGELARRANDPWFATLAFVVEAVAARGRGEPVAAEDAFKRGRESCSIAYRCADLELKDAELAMFRHVLPSAQESIARGVEWAKRSREWFLELKLLEADSQLELFRMELEYARAGLEEAAAREPNDPDIKEFTQVTLAQLATFEGNFEETKQRILRANPTGLPLLSGPAWILADAYRVVGATAEERASLRATIEAVRNTQPPESKLALLDMVEGRVLSDVDASASQTLLRAAIARADRLSRDDAETEKARSLAYTTLIVDGTKAGRLPEALRLFSEGARVRHRDACVLGVALDDDKRAIVSSDARGLVRGQADRNPFFGRIPQVDRLVPEEIVRALSDCSEVFVLARPALAGRRGLLPSSMAWSYIEGRGDAPASTNTSGNKYVLVTDIPADSSTNLAAPPPYLVPQAEGEGVRVELRGSNATPRHVLDAIEDATEIEFFTHGVLQQRISDVSALVLARGGTGDDRLTAEKVVGAKLTKSPLVLLGACYAGQTAPDLHRAWSLPAAFIHAGARAVIAADAEIPALEAGTFFSEFREAVRRDPRPAVVLRDLRAKYVDNNKMRWLDAVVVIQP